MADLGGSPRGVDVYRVPNSAFLKGHPWSPQCADKRSSRLLIEHQLSEMLAFRFHRSRAPMPGEIQQGIEKKTPANASLTRPSNRYRTGVVVPACPYQNASRERCCRPLRIVSMETVPVADGRYLLRENRHVVQFGEFPDAYRNEHRASFDPPLGGVPIFP